MSATTNRKPPPVGKGGKKGQKRHREMTETDRIFVREYLKHGNATAAYHAAGFNGNNPAANASKMLHKRAIQRVLKAGEQKAVTVVARKLEITVDKVLQDLEEARLTALGSMPSPQCAAAIKASELQGKHIGMFRDDFADRDQMPLIMIRTGDGTVVAMAAANQAALMPPIAVPQPLPDGVDEVLTDDDLL